MRDKSKLIFAPCQNYDKIQNTIKNLVQSSSIVKKSITKKSNIFILPGLIDNVKDVKAVNSDSRFIKAVIYELLKFSHNITIGDIPLRNNFQNIIKKNKLDIFFQKNKIKIANMESFLNIKIKKGGGRNISVPKPIVACDIFIILTKFKTSIDEYFSGILDSYKRLIPKIIRSQSNYDQLIDSALDIFACFPPKFLFIDGVIAQEGNGPLKGKPSPLNTIILSNDSLAADSIACRLISIDPLNVKSIQKAAERKLGSLFLNDIIQKNGDFKNFVNMNFKKAKTSKQK